jgi:hypothetical protein
VPALHRHYEATAPDKNVALSEPIPCSRVALDMSAVERALLSVMDVDDVAIRPAADGSLEAFVAVHEGSDLDVSQVKATLGHILAGYSIPEPLHLVYHAFPRVADGDIDFGMMEREVRARNALRMSPRAIVVRDIVGQLLFKDATSITGESDFFLLGGNSLLLGRLAYFIKKETGQMLKVSDIFTNSTINGIASLIDGEASRMSMVTLSADVKNGKTKKNFRESDIETLDDVETLDYAYEQEHHHSRGATHPLSLMVQIIPLTFMYPLKASLTWAMMLFILGHMTNFITAVFWQRIGTLFLAIFVARVTARVLAPVAAILFKWIVIGKYKPGTYKMSVVSHALRISPLTCYRWSTYHLRWWIVNQALRAAGRGVFATTPYLERLHMRLLGARIGRDVHISGDARLGEYDLITIEDGARIDKALIRGFCVERDGYFRLDTIHIGRRACINTYTQIAPGAVVPDGKVYGPHASSHESPSPKFFANYNRTLTLEPSFMLKLFVAWPIIFLVNFISAVPWMVMLYLMMTVTKFTYPKHLDGLELVIYWFSTPQRIGFHILARVVRAVLQPLLKIALGIIVKRVLGLNEEGLASNASQMSLLRRYINASLLSQSSLKRAFDILGTHYEATSVRPSVPLVHP